MFTIQEPNYDDHKEQKVFGQARSQEDIVVK